MMKFITAWAAAASGDSSPCRTRELGFELGRYFPAREHPSSFDLWKAQKPNANLKSRMLVFTKEKLASLKRAAVASTESTVADPTRVELVSSFLWNNVSKFLKAHPERGQFGAMLSVNVRARLSPTQKILENVFGNFIAPACVFPSDDDAVEEFHETVMKFRTSIRSISGEIPSDAESQEQMVEGALSILGDVKELYPITTWCRYPIYEVDFGWGKPVWFCSPRSGIKNGILLLDARNGEDVELWLLNLDPEILEILEKEFELI